MASSPVRYPSGVSTFKFRDNLATFPSVPTPNQYAFFNPDFVPYLPGSWTTTQTNGTIAAFPWNSGAIKLTTTGTTAADAVYLTGMMASEQFQANNQNWFEVDIAVPTTSATDTTIRAGLTDTVNPASATNGILFVKPAGGTAVNLQIIKAGVTTTITNIGDIARPSGFFGDTTSTVGTMTANATGTTLTALTIATPGSGYQKNPLVVINGTAGSGATGRVEIGSSNLTGGGGGGPVLYNSVVTAPGSGYTAGTITAEISHFLRLSIYFDARGTLWISVNQTPTVSFGRFGVTTVLTGGTVDASVTMPDSYTTATQLATGMTFLPVAGDFMNIAPLVQLYPAVGFLNSTANARTAYVDKLHYAGEY